jgi:hypothetical protein
MEAYVFAYVSIGTMLQKILLIFLNFHIDKFQCLKVW